MEEVQQQLKQNQLRIYGFSDCKGETLIRKVEEFLEVKLGVKNAGIIDCYRTEPSNKNNQRPVLLTFKDILHNNAVFLNKKQLKGSKVIITEELVKSRYDLYQLARENIGAMHVWTMNGKIFTKHNERKVHIRNEEDVLKIKK
nr:unnamed protein product [Callosobruchus analis]